MTILHRAVKSGDIESVKDLVTNGFDVNSVDSEGQTPLFETCYLNDEIATQIAEFLS